jgi:hypothetical protein
MRISPIQALHPGSFPFENVANAWVEGITYPQFCDHVTSTPTLVHYEVASTDSAKEQGPSAFSARPQQSTTTSNQTNNNEKRRPIKKRRQ